MTNFVPTHRTPQGPVMAKQWFGHYNDERAHPAVRRLEEVDRRALRSQNLPAAEAHEKGDLHVGVLDKVNAFVFPGDWIYQDERGDLHLRSDTTHKSLAIPISTEPPPPASSKEPDNKPGDIFSSGKEQK